MQLVHTYIHTVYMNTYTQMRYRRNQCRD